MGVFREYFQNSGDKLNFRISTYIDVNNCKLKNSRFMRIFRGFRYGLDVQMWDIRQLSTMNTWYNSIIWINAYYLTMNTPIFLFMHRLFWCKRVFTILTIGSIYAHPLHPFFSLFWAKKSAAYYGSRCDFMMNKGL